MSDGIEITIATALALLYAALHPLGDGLFDTSLWVAKVWAPPDSEENDSTKHLMKSNQAALMHGWLSNVPFVEGVALVSSLAVAAFYHWWFAFVMLFLSTNFGLLAKVYWGRSASYYLLLLYQKMVQRAADYKKQNDIDRMAAAESFCEELGEMLLIYHNAKLRPPSPKQLRNVPYGDVHYWLDHGSPGFRA